MLRYLMPWIVGCLLVAAPATAQAQAGDPAKVRALLAGVSAYPALDKKYQLPRAVQDARGLRDLLVTKLGVPAGNIQLLDNSPTLSKLREEWDKHLKKLKPGDVSIFYFSGHGVEDGKRPLLLTTEYKDSAYAAGFNLADELNGFAKNHGGSTGIFITVPTISCLSVTDPTIAPACPWTPISAWDSRGVSSRSIHSTLRPWMAANPCASIIAIVVFPTPPFSAKLVTTLAAISVSPEPLAQQCLAFGRQPQIDQLIDGSKARICSPRHR